MVLSLQLGLLLGLLVQVNRVQTIFVHMLRLLFVLNLFLLAELLLLVLLYRWELQESEMWIFVQGKKEMITYG